MLAPLCLVFLLFVPSAPRETGFVYCPAYPCLCEPKDGQLVINCRYLYLTELPKFLSFEGRIHELSLRKNTIRFLPANAFRGLNIQSIDLTDNIVTQVHDDAFAGLENSLEELQIQVYAMEDLPIRALERLKRLTKLKFIGCRVPKLRSDTFTALTQLVELHLVSCRIKNIEPGGIGTLRNLRELDLSNNNIRYEHLREISKLYDLRKLVLADNDIRVLGSKAFDRLLHLRYIDLFSNSMTTIDKNAFKSLEYSLEVLRLEKNHLRNKALLSIRSLRNLRNLNLAFNNITKIASGVFYRLEVLSQLDISNNAIPNIKYDTFKGTGKSLRILKLGGNPLKQISNGTFSQHRMLRQLFLDNTSMNGKFEPSVFNGLGKSLEKLSLKGTNLTSRDFEALTKLSGLKDLNLSANNIDALPDRIFKKMNSLQKLDLSKNSISKIQDNAFDGLEMSIQSIDLQSNEISSISKCTFGGFNRLGDIRLGSNPLACDCRLAWLHNWLRMHYPDFQRSMLDWTCASPKTLANKPFRLLSLSDLKCSKKNRFKESQCKWSEERMTLPVIPISVDDRPSPMLPVDLMGTEVFMNLDSSMPKVMSVKWNMTSTHHVGGYRVVVRRTNDSFEVRDILVSTDTERYIFAQLTPGFEYEICLTVLSKEEVPLARECRVEVTESEVEPEKESNTPGPSFVTLMWAYTLGSLGVTVLFALIAICIRRSQLKKIGKKFAPGYSAWAGMLYGVPSSQATSSCYFNSTATGYDDVDMGDGSECCQSHAGACSTVSTFRRNLPANYIVSPSDVNDDFYFHF